MPDVESSIPNLVMSVHDGIKQERQDEADNEDISKSLTQFAGDVNTKNATSHVVNENAETFSVNLKEKHDIYESDMHTTASHENTDVIESHGYPDRDSWANIKSRSDIETCDRELDVNIKSRSDKNVVASKIKRKRGRPCKSGAILKCDGQGSSPHVRTGISIIKRKPGRPRKTSISTNSTGDGLVRAAGQPYMSMTGMHLEGYAGSSQDDSTATGMEFELIDLENNQDETHINYGVQKKVAEGKPDWHVCKLCGKKARKLIFIQNHVNKCHLSEDKKRYIDCKFCPEKFLAPLPLRTHMQSMHPDVNLNKKRRYKSLPEGIHETEGNDDITRPTYGILKQVDGHLKYTWVCKFCQRVFNVKENLKSHINKYHKPDDQKQIYFCEYCAKEFNSNQGLFKHVDTLHKGKAPHRCAECNGGYSTPQGLKIHIVSVHRKNELGDTWLCDQCSCRYPSKYHLLRHVRRVHSNKDKHECPVCGKTFSRRDNLKVHCYSHTGEMPLSCQFCQFRCKQKASLLWHNKKHHPDISVKKEDANTCQIDLQGLAPSGADTQL